MGQAQAAGRTVLRSTCRSLKIRARISYFNVPAHPKNFEPHMNTRSHTQKNLKQRPRFDKPTRMAFGRTLFRWVVALVIFLSCIKFWTPIFSKPSSGRKLGIPDGDVSIFASHAINNTVVVVPVNIGMLQWAANLLCSLTETSFDGKDIVFWALDEGAEDALRVKGYATYRDKRLYASRYATLRQISPVLTNVKARTRIFMTIPPTSKGW